MLAAVLTATLLVGCGPSEEELRRQRLEEALDATFAVPVAFTLELDAAEEALATFGADAGPLAGLLARSSVAGVLEDDGVALGLTLSGIELLQARSIDGGGSLYVRSDLTGLAELLRRPGADSFEDELRADLADAGLAPEVVAAVLAGVRGDWVQLEQATPPDDEVGVAGVLRALLGSGEVVRHLGDLEQDGAFDGQLTVDIEPRRAGAAIAELIEDLDPSGSVGGAAPDLRDAPPVRSQVVVTGGTVRTIDVSLAALLSALTGSGTDAAAAPEVALLLTLRGLEVDEDDPYVEQPEVAASVTTDELTRALSVIGTRIPVVGS